MFCRINLASWYLLNITKQLHIFREKFSTLTNQKLSLRSCDFSFNQPETFPKVMWFQLQPARNFPWGHVIWLRGNGSAVDVIFKTNKSRNLRGNFKNSKYRKKKYFFGYVNTKIITLKNTFTEYNSILLESCVQNECFLPGINFPDKNLKSKYKQRVFICKMFVQFLRKENEIFAFVELKVD